MATMQQPQPTNPLLWLRKRVADLFGFQTKGSPVGSMIVSSYGLTQPVRLPRRFDKLADNGYGQQAPVFHAINLIATACAGIPWQLHQKTKTSTVGTAGKPQGDEITDHPLLDLMKRPNPTQGWGKFFEAYVAFLYIAGNSYLWANRAKTGKGTPVELWTLRPDRMRVIPDPKNFVGGYTYEINGQGQNFPVSDVLHTKTFAPLDDWYGMSPLVVAARNIDIRNAGGDWNLALLQNGGKVPGFFTTKERLGDVQFQRMREQLIDRYTGSRNVGLPGLLDGGDISWLEAGKTPLDMDWSNQLLAQSRDIAITIGVPPEMLGDPEVKTYASYGEARASFHTETVLPLMDILRDELNRWLVPMYGDPSLFLDYNKEDIEALAPLRAARWAQVNTSNFLTVNEKRQAVGYDPIPEGDVIVLLNTNATLQEVLADAVAKPVEPPGAAPGTPPAGGTPARVLPKPDGSGGSSGSGGDNLPAPTPDGGVGAAVEGGQTSNGGKSKSYDPLDDILAGKVVDLRSYRPKAQRPRLSGQRPAATPSRYRQLTPTGTH